MANRLISTATGNFTTAGSWGVCDATAASVTDSETGTVAITTSTSTHICPTTTPGVISVDGICLKLSSRVASPTGTFTVVLRNITGAVDVTSVVVNVADLPASGGWCFFKFSGTQVLIGATGYAVRVTCSVSSEVTLYRVSAQDYSRLYRTTTTAAPAAGDQMIVSKQFLSAGSATAVTITMDNTASTVFGATTYVDSLAVSGGGVLTWGSTASTNYLLTIAGLVTVWDTMSTWNQGTSTTRIPSTSTAKLIFSNAANVDGGFLTKGTAISNRYGNIVTADSTLLTVSRGGYCTTNGTAVTGLTGQSFTGLTGAIVINGVGYTISSVTNATSLTLTGSAGVQASAVAWTHAGTATALTVASTAGWAANDYIVVASTSRTTADSEIVQIASVDSSTTVTLVAGLTVQHSGDSPTQAEVIHLTRNVTVEGTSTTFQAYVNYSATSVVNDSYCEFKNLGSATASKRGIDVATTTGTYTAIGCTLHESAVASSLGWNVSGVSGSGSSITYCHTWNTANIAFTVVATSGSVILDHCIACKNAAGVLFNLLDVGSTYTNLTAISGTASGAITISEATPIAGTISGLTAHSSGSIGINLTYWGGTISTVTSWRNGSSGLQFGTSFGAKVSTSTLFGNTTQNLSFNVAFDCVLSSATISGDSIFATASGASVVSNSCGTNYITNSTFGVVSGIKTAHTNDITPSATLAGRIVLRACNLASATEVTNLTTMTPSSSVVSEKHDQTAGSHKRWERYGIAAIDTVTFNAATPAETLTPNNASNKFGSSPTQPIAIDNGQTATVTVTVNKSASYNGAQPRLILRENYAIGFTVDTVLATASGGTGSWLTLSGTTPAATDDGAFVCYVDCDGTAGTVSVDDWSVV